MTSEITLIKSNNHAEFENHIREFINDGYKAKWETFRVNDSFTTRTSHCETNTYTNSRYYIIMERKEKVDKMSEEMIMKQWNER